MNRFNLLAKRKCRFWHRQSEGVLFYFIFFFKLYVESPRSRAQATKKKQKKKREKERERDGLFKNISRFSLTYCTYKINLTPTKSRGRCRIVSDAGLNLPLGSRAHRAEPEISTVKIKSCSAYNLQLTRISPRGPRTGRICIT